MTVFTTNLCKPPVRMTILAVIVPVIFVQRKTGDSVAEVLAVPGSMTAVAIAAQLRNPLSGRMAGLAAQFPVFAGQRPTRSHLVIEPLPFEFRMAFGAALFCRDIVTR